MSDIQTPISEAKSRYRSLRRRRRRLSAQDRIWYYQLRYLQNHTANWRARGKAALVGMAEESLAETKRTLANWTEFHDWISAQADTIKGKANRASYALICAKVDASVARVQEVVDDYADDDSVIETITDSIIAAALPLGLEPHEAWEDADDGAVWFVNPETGHKHYFLRGAASRRMALRDHVATDS